MMNVQFPMPASSELLDLCNDWHGGQTSAMYSVLSTGYIHDEAMLCGLASEMRMSAERAAFYATEAYDYESELNILELIEDTFQDD